MLSRWLLSAGLAAAAAAMSAPPTGLYGLDENAALIRRTTPGGAWVTVGSPLPYAQAQQLSCIDAARGLFYMVGYSRSASEPFLVGVSLADGSVVSATALPFVDQQYVGIGQYVAVEPASARVFVGGQDASRNHIVGLVDPAGGSFEILANLSSSLRDVFGGTSAFVPATNELYFELDLDIMILNLATRNVTVLPVSPSFSILGMNYDPALGVIVGLDGGPGQGVRTIVSLDPRARVDNVTGSVPQYAMQMGGMTAYDAAARTVFWIAQETSAPSDAPWYLVQNAAAGGAVVTAEPICVAGGVCPWSIHYYNNGTAGH